MDIVVPMWMVLRLLYCVKAESQQVSSLFGVWFPTNRWQVIKGPQKVNPVYFTSALAYKPRRHQMHIKNRYADDSVKNMWSFSSHRPLGYIPVCFSHIYFMFVCTFTTSCTTVQTLPRQCCDRVVTLCSWASYLVSSCIKEKGVLSTQRSKVSCTPTG